MDSHWVDLVADVKESLILRGLLWTWARWGALQNLGYPQRAAFAGNGKMPLYSPTDCTPEVAEVEKAVCQLEYEDRCTIICRYIWRMKYHELAERFGCSMSKAHRKVLDAESAFRIQYNYLQDGKNSSISRHAVQLSLEVVT